jgi:predicted phage replisome organizer
MKNITWIKLSLDVFDNRKTMYLLSLPQGEKYLLMWMYLLVCAGKANNEGKLTITDAVPITPESLSKTTPWPLKVIKTVLKELEILKMIEIDQGVIRIANWDKYQSAKKMQDIHEYKRLAKQRQRERYKTARRS